MVEKESKPRVAGKIMSKKQPQNKDTTPSARIKMPGVIYIGHLPWGFEESGLKGYFSQFGKVKNLRVARSRKTGNSKGYAFIQFEHDEVAKIAAETMDNYLMFGKLIKCKHIKDVHPSTFKGKKGQYQPQLLKKALIKYNAAKSEEQLKAMEWKTLNKYRSKIKKLKEMGIQYRNTVMDERVKAMLERRKEELKIKAEEDTDKMKAGDNDDKLMDNSSDDDSSDEAAGDDYDDDDTDDGSDIDAPQILKSGQKSSTMTPKSTQGKITKKGDMSRSVFTPKGMTKTGNAGKTPLSSLKSTPGMKIPKSTGKNKNRNAITNAGSSTEEISKGQKKAERFKTPKSGGKNTSNGDLTTSVLTSKGLQNIPVQDNEGEGMASQTPKQNIKSSFLMSKSLSTPGAKKRKLASAKTDLSDKKKAKRSQDFFNVTMLEKKSLKGSSGRISKSESEKKKASDVDISDSFDLKKTKMPAFKSKTPDVQRRKSIAHSQPRGPKQTPSRAKLKKKRSL